MQRCSLKLHGCLIRTVRCSHTLPQPLEPLQVFTWTLLVVLVAEFYAFVIPGLSVSAEDVIVQSTGV